MFTQTSARTFVVLGVGGEVCSTKEKLCYGRLNFRNSVYALTKRPPPSAPAMPFPTTHLVAAVVVLHLATPSFGAPQPPACSTSTCLTGVQSGVME